MLLSSPGKMWRICTGMLPGLESMSSKDRSNDKLGLFYPECRRLRGDIREVCKIMKGSNRAVVRVEMSIQGGIILR